MTLPLVNLLLVMAGPFVVVGAVTGIAMLGWPRRLVRPRRPETVLFELVAWLASAWLPDRTVTLLARH